MSTEELKAARQRVNLEARELAKILREAITAGAIPDLDMALFEELLPQLDALSEREP